MKLLLYQTKVNINLPRTSFDIDFYCADLAPNQNHLICMFCRLLAGCYVLLGRDEYTKIEKQKYIFLDKLSVLMNQRFKCNQSCLARVCSPSNCSHKALLYGNSKMCALKTLFYHSQIFNISKLIHEGIYIQVINNHQQCKRSIRNDWKQ